MAKIYRVIQIKLNQLVKENVHMITDLPTKRILELSQWQSFLRVFTYNCHRYGTKYVTATLCTRAASMYHSAYADCCYRCV